MIKAMVGFAVAPLFLLSAQSHAIPSYTAVTIATLPASSNFTPSAVNDNGIVAGAEFFSGGPMGKEAHIIEYSKKWGKVDFGTPGPAESWISGVTGINNKNAIIGWTVPDFLSPVGAVYRDPNTGFGSIKFPNNGVPSSINDKGWIAGSFREVEHTDSPQAWIVTPDSTSIDLGTLAGNDNPVGDVIPPSSYANDINNYGLVVGSSMTEVPGTGNNSYHAFIGSLRTGLSDIGEILGSGNSTAIGVNDKGQVVGVYGQVNLANLFAPVIPRMSGSGNIFLYDSKSHQMKNLGEFGGSPSTVNGISNSGVFFGASKDGAFVGDASGFFDLNSLIVNRSAWEGPFDPLVMSESGILAGTQMGIDGRKHIYLLVPNGNDAKVPEPQSFVLLLIGLMGFVYHRSRGAI